MSQVHVASARGLARWYGPAATGLFVAVLWGTMALRIESWPFSAYPMYSVPRDVSRLAVTRFAFELEDGEVVAWKPHFAYLAKDLDERVVRGRREGELDAVLGRAARAVRADFRSERGEGAASRVRRVIALEKTTRPEAGGSGWVVEERRLASFEAGARP